MAFTLRAATGFRWLCLQLGSCQLFPRSSNSGRKPDALSSILRSAAPGQLLFTAPPAPSVLGEGQECLLFLYSSRFCPGGCGADRRCLYQGL